MLNDMSQELSDFILVSKYAKHNEKLKRRETWGEAVGRVYRMHVKKYPHLSAEYQEKLSWAFGKVLKMEDLPSMRSLQFGGIAIEAKNARMFNCSVRHIDSLRSFAESFWLLLCGCGVGFGLNEDFLGRLPNLVDASDKTGTVINYVIEDTIEGWADSLEALLMCYFKNTPHTGRKIVFDYSRIRKKGSKLKTGGGKAPGYSGLKATHQKIKALLDFIIEDLNVTRLRSVDAYDILMHSADAVLSGGIRRSACSVVFWKDDQDMMTAKTNFKVPKYKQLEHSDNAWHVKVFYKNKWKDISFPTNSIITPNPKDDWNYKQLVENGQVSWLYLEPQRARSNNTVLLLRNSTSFEEFQKIVEFTQLWGEPGFAWANHKWVLFNPCFEIGFIPVLPTGETGVQFCNLSTQNGGRIKTLQEFLDCAEAATIIGTCQAGFTKFDYLGPASKRLTEEEALLGVSITGIMDHPEIVLNPEYQQLVVKHVVETNKKWAKTLGINQAARTTCVKPEGTSSPLLKTRSGIGPAHAGRYFRRVQCNKLEGPYNLLKSKNPHACEESVWSAGKTDDVVTFCITAPETAITRDQLSAIKHLEYIRSTQCNWVRPGTTEANTKDVEHNVSCTVNVKHDEWTDVIKFIYDNRRDFTAVSLLPFSGDKDYPQAPFESVATEEDEKRWNMLCSEWQPVNYQEMIEDEDETQLNNTVACAGGKCEI